MPVLLASLWLLYCRNSIVQRSVRIRWAPHGEAARSCVIHCLDFILDVPCGSAISLNPRTQLPGMLRPEKSLISLERSLHEGIHAAAVMQSGIVIGDSF